MITSQGMLVCSFNLKQRFSRGEENVYPLNQQYELKLENETLRIEDAAKFFQIFCQENSKFTDDTIKMKLFSVKENSFCKIVRDTYTAVSFVIKSGGYGVEGEITDRTSQVVTYHRKENESDVKEFLCVVYIPHDIGNLQIKKGILVFQSIGAYGVKTISIVEEIPETLVRERSADKIRNYMISTADMYKERMVWGNRGEI